MKQSQPKAMAAKEKHETSLGFHGIDGDDASLRDGLEAARSTAFLPAAGDDKMSRRILIFLRRQQQRQR